jgi:hypothetical protein
MQITIHKLIWQLHAPTQKAAVKSQQIVAELSRNAAFLAALETRLADLGFKDEHVIIAKLELDLGSIDERSFEANLKTAVLKKCGEAVADMRLTKSNQERIRIPLAGKIAAQFAAFLKTGIVPAGWPSGMQTHTDVAVWLAHELAQQATLAKTLLDEFFAHSEASKMLANTPTEIYLREIAGTLNLNAASVKIAQQLLGITSISGQSELKKNLSQHMWRFMLEADKSKAESALAEAAFLVKKALPTLPDKAKSAAKKVLAENAKLLAKASEVPREAAVSKKETPQLTREADSGYFVQNAGLVLIAPFLPVFFELSGVATKKELTNPGKALALLAALDLGARGHQSADYTLYKLLCGLALDAELPAKIALTKKEKGQAESLLVEGIGHWKALKNTSPDGLRTGFFWRDGVITPKDNGYLLRVETRAQDVLLGSLPWGIGLIKLPWMDEPIHVDWG